MATLRFDVPPEHALLTLADASGGLTALFAFDAHMGRHLAWLSEAAEAVGGTAAIDDAELKDARAIANAQTEPMRALRTELAELAADAEAQLPAGVSWAGEIVSQHAPAQLPDTLGPDELLRVERSFRVGMTRHLLAATESLGPLAERLRGFDDAQCRALAERIESFVAAVRGG
jgi:hypothetical protein